MRKTVVRLLRRYHAVAIENGVGIGTPDVNCSLGWIELKSVDRPARGGPVRVEHFTQEQRIWLKQRWRGGGAASLLLKVGPDWLLLAGDAAAREVGERTMLELIDLSVAVWNRTPTAESLASALEAVLRLKCWERTCSKKT